MSTSATYAGCFLTRVLCHLLLQWSGEIGSDISVFFSRGAAYCTGRCVGCANFTAATVRLLLLRCCCRCTAAVLPLPPPRRRRCCMPSAVLLLPLQLLLCWLACNAPSLPTAVFPPAIPALLLQG